MVHGYWKIILSMFCVALLTISISIISFVAFESTHNQTINNTAGLILNDSILTQNATIQFNIESNHDFLTKDGRDFKKQYTDINVQEQRNQTTIKGRLSVDNKTINADEHSTTTKNATIVNMQNIDPNIIKVKNKILKMFKMSENLFKVRKNRYFVESLMDYIDFDQITTIQQITKPILCLMNKISDLASLEIDIKDDIGFFFEYNLIKNNGLISTCIKEYHKKCNETSPNNNEEAKKSLLFCLNSLFVEIYYFANMPFRILRSSYKLGFEYHDILQSIDSLKIKNIAPLNVRDKYMPFLLSNIYKFNDEKKGKNIIIFKFKIEKVFGANLFRGLMENHEMLTQKLDLIKEKTVTSIKHEIKNKIKFYNIDDNIAVLIMLPSFRNFMKHVCIDNYKDLYDSSNGIYFYERTDIKKYDNLISKTKNLHEEFILKNQLLAIPPQTESYLLYHELYNLYTNIGDALGSFLDDEINFRASLKVVYL